MSRTSAKPKNRSSTGAYAMRSPAIAAGHWSFDPRQTTGILLPGRLPLDELLFFLVVPLCAILGFEAVRAVLRLPAGDE